MSLVGTLAKVAVGLVVAKGLGNAITGAKDSPEAAPRGGSIGHGTPYGRSGPPPTGSSPDGGFGDILGQVLGRRGPRNRGSLGSALEELSDLSRPGQGTHRSAPRPDGGFAKPGTGSFGDMLDQSLQRYGEPDRRPNASQEALAGVLLRALIQAAKSDGQIDEAEKQQLLKNLGELEPDEIEFVNEELAKPIDVSALVCDVPRGAEGQVYMMSVMGIDLDTRHEVQYLQQLASALDLDMKAVNAIHDRLGEPRIFR